MKTFEAYTHARAVRTQWNETALARRERRGRRDRGGGPCSEDGAVGKVRGSEQGAQRIGVAELLETPGLLVDVGQESIPALLADVVGRQTALASLHAALLARLVVSCQSTSPDVLLTVEEAARRLALSPDYLYRHSDALPFTVRVGANLRFSAKGIEEYIRRNSGRRHDRIDGNT